MTSIKQNLGGSESYRQMIQYVQRFGDSNFLRRLFLASNLRYKDDISREMDGIITDFEAGNLPISWGGDGNQTFPGQQDIDKDFLLGQLAQIAQDFGGSSSRARVDSGLMASIPPHGNQCLMSFNVCYFNT